MELVQINHGLGLPKTEKLEVVIHLGKFLHGHQEFQVPKMEGILNLISGYFGGGETPLHKPYPYSLYR